MAPTGIELWVRRMSWWQSICMEPEHHRQFLTAFFGDTQLELLRREAGAPSTTPTLDAQGRLNASQQAHPWARQLRTDLELLISHPMAEEFKAEWDGTMRNFLYHKSTTDAFRYIDMRQYRAAYVSAQWAPPRSMLAS